jgi:hypothetical protein
MKQDLCLRKCNQRFACCFLMAIRDNGLWETDAGEVYKIIKSDKASLEWKLNVLVGDLNFSTSSSGYGKFRFGSFPVIGSMRWVGQGAVE